MFKKLLKEKDNKKDSKNLELEAINKIKKDTYYYEKLKEEYKNNKNVIFTLLNKKDFEYKKLNIQSRKNINLFKEVVLHKKDGKIIRYAGNNIKQDFESILLATYFMPFCVDYVKNIYFEEDSEIKTKEFIYWIISKNEVYKNFIFTNLWNAAKLNKQDKIILELKELEKIDLEYKNILKKYVNISEEKNTNKRFSIKDLTNSIK